jgi:hypothetical protein
MTTIAQEIAVSSTFSHSSYNKFKNNFGYEIGYNQFIKLKSRLGFTFSQSFNNAEYNYIFNSPGDGIDYYRDVKPKNQKITISINYGFNILNKQQTKFYIGPKFGLNYFHIRENIDERPVNETESNQYNRNYWENNKIGIGLLLEYERKVSDKISVFLSTVPEVIFFSKFGLKGSGDDTIIGLISFNLGIKFNVKNQKDIEKKVNASR